MSSVQLDSRD